MFKGTLLEAGGLLLSIALQVGIMALFKANKNKACDTANSIIFNTSNSTNSSMTTEMPFLNESTTISPAAIRLTTVSSSF